MSDFVIGIFIAAARYAGRWPQPHRRLAWEALKSLPPDCFEPDIADAKRKLVALEDQRWN